MALRLLGGPTSNSGSPRLWLDEDQHRYLAQGYAVPGHPTYVQIPHMLLRWLEPGTCLGATLHDAGQGAFLLEGEPVRDPELLARMRIPAGELAVAVPVAASRWEW